MIQTKPNEQRPSLQRGWLKNGNPRGDPNSAPRCGAKTRRGTACQAPAMANGRCRMHGGASTGPRTPEGLARSRRSRWKHGQYSAESMAEQERVRDLLRQSRELLKQL
ncbi:MAG: HGGxSTG domain-containing protein [Terriglobales bacterium]